MATRINLHHSMFAEAERALARCSTINVSTFRYDGGIAALRITTPRAELVVLPFTGQQIWRAAFDGRDITMGSIFDEPVDTRVYLETYGAFLIHCGMLAIGGPAPEDTHPLHGELPNAPFQTAYLDFDEASGSVTLGGSYHHKVAFTAHYRAMPSITLGQNDTHIDVKMQVENLASKPMELMYLAHANFRPVDNGELIYAAPYTPEAVRVRQSIPSHISPPPGYSDFIDDLVRDPRLHHRLDPALTFDPEVVFSISMTPDDAGWAHAMQRHPDGVADFISYDTSTCPTAGRWICRTPEQQGLGIAFPATAGVEGYLAEKAKGNLVDLAAGGTWVASMRMGTLDPDAAARMAQKIDHVAGRS